ncbi:response regulator transcription factor [Cellulophaga sp. HaHaR_3_176]|uniref:response regulator transcription factor n=1 Tax=Cellulophaga sp. HaHaR_3_176 TaxID=1942464 RepID=UPI001C1F85F6|nr:response regulator transcription factor [Cellulophaga sp. HaHaR_3_176]QWX82611.1 response regulator transcription factor [Cellulophaga sp. HaHaR_3_176]
MLTNVLLIEDEQNVAAFIKKGLDELGFDVIISYTAKMGLELLHQKNIDIIILDVILPDGNGIDICKKIRALGYNQTPILMLTALGTTENIVEGLGAGADDYLTKPFKFRELVARLEALSRRIKHNNTTNQLVLTIADITLNCESKIVNRGGKELKLTSTEYRLLEYFLKNKNKVLSRIDILEYVWDIGFNMGTNVVDVYVNYLRNKIDRNSDTKLIHTVIGMGYIMKEETL